MEEEKKEKSSVLWIYLIPVFILAAWPAFQWMKKANNDNIELSKDDYSLFNSQEGEIRKTAAAATPEFNDGIMGVRYKSKPGKTANEDFITEEREQKRASAGKRPSTVNQGREKQEVTDPIKAQEQRSIGFTSGFMEAAARKIMNNPKAVNALFSNKYIINGFMARSTVKAATGSTQGLNNFLKGEGPTNFMNSPVVRAALKNPQVVSAVATSGIVTALLNTPVGKTLMNDPSALGALITSNPELMAMAMSNPSIMNMLKGNPDVSAIAKKFNLRSIKKQH